MLICFKTYFADQIGITESKYRVGNLGYDFDPDSYNDSLIILQKNKHNLRISSPFRIHFIDDKYHYLQLPRITFNFHKFAKISPPSVHVSSITIMTMRLVVIKLTNVLESASFTVNDIFTTSRSVFVDNINPRTLQPNETMSINLYFCPYDTAVRTALILIRTSLGLIPYSVSFQVIATFKDIGITTFFHQSTFHLINLTLRIPQIISDMSKLSILYDSQMFDPQKSTIMDRIVHLSPINNYLGCYFTFIHLISPTVCRTVPIFILSSNKYLMPYYPVIYINTVTSVHGYSEEEIKLLNLGSFNFNIVSISLKDSPSNVRIEVVSMPISCSNFCTTVIGKVVILGTRQGEIDTSLVIVYESVEMSKVMQSIEIPIRGYVEYGSFDPNETKIDKMIKYRNLRVTQLNELVDYYKYIHNLRKDKHVENNNSGYPEYQDYIEEADDDGNEEYDIGYFNKTGKIIEHNFIDYHVIHFTNHFKVPVAILCAQTDSEEITVVDFTPSIVMPGQKSKDIKIRFKYWTHVKKIVKYMIENGEEYKFTTDDMELGDDDEKISNDLVYIHEIMKAVLTVETNATNINIPIQTYNGQIVIYDSPDESSYDTGISKSLGKILSGSTTNFTFFIGNPNPVDFFVRDYNATPGINVNGFWRGNVSSPLRNHKMNPFSVEEFCMYVTFGHLKNTKQRNDSVSIGSAGTSVQIRFTWTPIIGKFVIHSSLPRSLRFGRFYQSKISITSTYPVTVKLHEISTSMYSYMGNNENENEQNQRPKSKSKSIFSFYSNPSTSQNFDYDNYKPPIYINYETPFLRPGVMTPCGNFSFIFGSRMLKKTYLSPLFNASIDYAEHKSMWDQYTNNGINYEIPLTLHFHSNMKVRRSLPVKIEFYHFNDIVIEGGTILAMHPSTFSAHYTNTIDCPVEFRMNIQSHLDKKPPNWSPHPSPSFEHSQSDEPAEGEDIVDEYDVINEQERSENEAVLDYENNSHSFSAYSGSATIVAQSREAFQFSFTITPHKSGQTFFRIPVTTNATPPFFIHVHANVEKPNVEIIDPKNGEKPVEAVEFQSQDEIKKSTWTKSFLLKNSGSLTVNLGKFKTKSAPGQLNGNDQHFNYFDINSNCSQTIEPGAFCQFDVSVKLIHLREFFEESVLSIKFADYWELTCPIRIRLSKECFAELKRKQHVATFFILVMATIQPLVTLLINFRNSLNLQNDINSRLCNLELERQRLSMSRLSVGTQVIMQKADIGGGVWSPQQTESKIRLTEETEQDLEDFLNSLC